MRRFAACLVLILAMPVGGLTVMINPAHAAVPADILATCHDANGRVIHYRNGTFDTFVGFGWQKVSQKHEITSYNAIGFIAHNPDGGVAEGKDRRYMAYANKKTCDASYTQCTVDESIPVKLIVHFAFVGDYYGAAVNAELGVKTAYCINDDAADACPSWVNGALRDSFSDTSAHTSASHDVTVTEWTYEPLALGTTHS
jgi:hypothetical protein